MTRKTTAHLFSSINGVVEAPDQFQFDAFGAEEGQFMAASLAEVTEVVIGRVLWQEWSDSPASSTPSASMCCRAPWTQIRGGTAPW